MCCQRVESRAAGRREPVTADDLLQFVDVALLERFPQHALGWRTVGQLIETEPIGGQTGQELLGLVACAAPHGFTVPAGAYLDETVGTPVEQRLEQTDGLRPFTRLDIIPCRLQPPARHRIGR